MKLFVTACQLFFGNRWKWRQTKLKEIMNACALKILAARQNVGRRLAGSLTTLLLLTLCLNTARSATVTWVNPAGGDWNDTNNWSTGALPGAGDDVIIPPGSPITVTHSTGTDTIHSLQNNQAFTLSGGSLTIATTLLASNTVTLSGGTLRTATIVTTNGASLVVSSGTLDGATVNGTLDVGNTVNGAIFDGDQRIDAERRDAVG